MYVYMKFQREKDLERERERGIPLMEQWRGMKGAKGGEQKNFVW